MASSPPPMNARRPGRPRGSRMTDFRTVGTRRKLVDKFNALRSTVRGKLGKIQHDHPEFGTDFADSFFR
jgi:hypothetical protein